MTFTKVTNTGIGSTGTILLQNLDVIGIVTAGFGVSTVDVFTTGVSTFSGVTNITNTTDSTSSTTGALIVSGGVGIAASLNVGGSVSVGGTLTYEDVTNVDSIGIITARSNILVGSGITLSPDGNIFAVGVVTTPTLKLGLGVTISSSGDSFATGVTTVGSLDISTGFIKIPDSIIHVGDANTKIRFPAADTISFETVGDERLRITSTGTVGINTDSPTARLEVIDSKVRTYDPTSQTEILVERNGNCMISIIGNTTSNCVLNFGDSDDENAGSIDYDHNDNTMNFRTAGVSNRLRINTEGYVKGNVNIPAWYGRQDSTHSVGNGAWTTVRNLGSYAVNPSMNNGGWDESTGIFTAQAGQAGTYYVYGQAAIDDVMDNDVVRAGFSKNDGTVPSYSQTRCLDQGSNVIVNSGLIAQTVELAVGDTIKLQVYHNEGNSQNTEAIYTFFGGYRIST